MDHAALRNLIDADPSLAALSDADAADAINARTVTARVSRLVTKTTVYRTLGFAAGLQLTATLKALSQSSDPATALKFGEILDLLRVDGDGIDVSLDETRAVIDQLAAAGVMAAGAAADIKALGEESRPLWSTLADRPLDFADVARAKAL